MTYGRNFEPMAEIFLHDFGISGYVHVLAQCAVVVAELAAVGVVATLVMMVVMVVGGQTKPQLNCSHGCLGSFTAFVGPM